MTLRNKIMTVLAWLLWNISALFVFFYLVDKTNNCLLVSLICAVLATILRVLVKVTTK